MEWDLGGVWTSPLSSFRASVGAWAAMLLFWWDASVLVRKNWFQSRGAEEFFLPIQHVWAAFAQVGSHWTRMTPPKIHLTPGTAHRPVAHVRLLRLDGTSSRLPRDHCLGLIKDGLVLLEGTERLMIFHQMPALRVQSACSVSASPATALFAHVPRDASGSLSRLSSPESCLLM